MQSGEGLPWTPFGARTIHALVDKAFIQGYGAQNVYYSVNWNWTGGVASEPNVESTVGSTEPVRVWNCIAVEPSRLWVRALSPCLLNIPEECCFTVTNPWRTSCSRGQYHKQEFQLCTNIPDPCAPTDPNIYFSIYLQSAKINRRLLHIWVWLLLKMCEVIDEYVFYCMSPWWQKLHFTRAVGFKLAFKSLIREDVEL